MRKSPSLLLPLVLLLAAAAHAAPTGLLALVTGEDQDTQQAAVYDLAAKKLTPVGPGNCDGAPVWSPDGARLAFHAKLDGKLLIYVVNTDGTSGRFLKCAHDWNQDLRWSPDGTRLAYTADTDGDQKTAIMVYDLAHDTEAAWGGGQPALMRPVFLPSTMLIQALQPDVSEKQFSDPTAEGLRNEALAADSAGVLLCVGIVGAPGKLSTELFIATPGFALPLLPLVPNYGESLRYAEWYAEPNPKGDRLAFETNDGGDREIFVLGKRGLLNVTNATAADWAPAWSPDGKTLAFESFRGGRRGVYRAFTDTARVLPVYAPAHADAFAPAWSPDGKTLACTTMESGHPAVTLIDLKNGKATPLDLPVPTDSAAWQPKPKKK